jgi:hypothetical protein
VFLFLPFKDYLINAVSQIDEESNKAQDEENEHKPASNDSLLLPSNVGFRIDNVLA